MNNGLSKLAKFFIICAAVCVAGIACLIGGVAAGGVEDIDKLAEEKDWIQGSAGERGVTAQKVDAFDSVQLKGDADVWMLGREFYGDPDWMESEDLLYETEQDVLGKNKVIVIAGDKVPQPEISVREGVLTVEYKPQKESGISLNLSDAPYQPRILICCPEDPLKSVEVSGDFGDTFFRGVSWKRSNIDVDSGDVSFRKASWETMDIDLDSGDVRMKDVRSGGLNIRADSGDVRGSGEFLGTTAATVDSGDVSLSTTLAEEDYSLDLRSESGEITLSKPGEKDAAYPPDSDGAAACTRQGGPHSLTLKSDSGEIRVRFAGK